MLRLPVLPALGVARALLPAASPLLATQGECGDTPGKRCARRRLKPTLQAEVFSFMTSLTHCSMTSLTL